MDWADADGRGCQICEARKRHLICPACVRKTVVTDKVLRNLEATTLRKEEVESKLRRALQTKECLQKEKEPLCVVTAALQAARVRRLQATERKQKVLREAGTLREVIQRKLAEQLADSLAEVEDAKQEFEKGKLAETQQQRLHLHVNKDQLTIELRKHVRVLLEILPLGFSRQASGRPSSAAASRQDTSTSPAVTICGCQLPNSLAVPPGANQQKLGTGLGYVTLLTQTLSALMTAALLNRLHFKGSTSEVWLQRSFWDGRPLEQGTIYRLYHSYTLPQPSRPAALPQPPARGLAALKHHWPFEGAFKSVTVAAPSVSVSSRRQKEDLAAAIHQLARSIGALRADQGLHFQLRLPQDWSPFAALAGLCMQLAAEPRSDGRRSLTASLAAPPTARGADRMALLDAFILDGEQDDEEYDGWDLVQRPVGLSAAYQQGRPDPLRMPPTPSDEDEAIAHWERAMITDSSGTRYRPAQTAPFSVGLHIAPLGQGARAAADRLWQGFRWSS